MGESKNELFSFAIMTDGIRKDEKKVDKLAPKKEDNVRV